MSRVPGSSSRTPRKAPSANSLKAPTASLKAPASPSKNSRSLKPTTSVQADVLQSKKLAPDSPAKGISIKEQIALKRAEAKKASLAPQRVFSEEEAGYDATGSPIKASPQEEDILGRVGVTETIERAKRTGNLNLNSRSLPCLPRYLFDSHLGVAPEPLALLPGSNEAVKVDDLSPKTLVPSWQAHDLVSLKASDNDFIAIQPEISLFGSLKHLDLSKNSLSQLPNSLADLVNLAYLDVSRNKLVAFPSAFSGLPALHTLLAFENEITSLDLHLEIDSTQNGAKYDSFYAPTVVRASEPLPKLSVLDISKNQLAAESVVPEHIPRNIEQLNLCSNPLGGPSSQLLLDALSLLPALRSLEMENCGLAPDAFAFVSQANPSGAGVGRFPKLGLLKLGEGQVTEDNIRSAFSGRQLDLTAFHVSDGGSPPVGTLKVILGKRIMKEKWELEAERRVRGSRSTARLNMAETSASGPAAVAKEVVKEDWEIEAEQGLLTEGAKRRARIAANANSQTKPAGKQSVQHKPLAGMDSWDADPGLVPEGGKQTAHAAQSREPAASPSKATHGDPIASFYREPSQTLHLPQALPSPKSHSRARSLATNLASSASDRTSLLVPSTTLPLSKIATSSFANTLRVLILSNRRVDCAFEVNQAIDASFPPPLPVLDELQLDACNIPDQVTISTGEGSPRTTMPIFDALSSLFPSLSVLNLSQNNITSLVGVDRLLIPDWDKRRKGLRVFRIEGNRLSDLDGLAPVWDGWKGESKVDAWRLEELDVRGNEIGKLPPELGLLPLDVLLVDGNTFRVPARRVWEREGTKGLQQWLKDRLA